MNFGQLTGSFILLWHSSLICIVSKNSLYYCCISSSWHPLLVVSDWRSLLTYPGHPLLSTKCAALQSTIEIDKKTQPTISILIWVTRTSFDCRMKVAWLALSITLTKPLFTRLFMNFTRKGELFTHHSVRWLDRWKLLVHGWNQQSTYLAFITDSE